MKQAAVAAVDNQLSFKAPSPVYPDLVAIMSLERLWNWLSTLLRPTYLRRFRIGGKIEFEKDRILNL